MTDKNNELKYKYRKYVLIASVIGPVLYLLFQVLVNNLELDLVVLADTLKIYCLVFGVLITYFYEIAWGLVLFIPNLLIRPIFFFIINERPMPLDWFFKDIQVYSGIVIFLSLAYYIFVYKKKNNEEKSDS